MAKEYYELAVRMNVRGFPMECVFHGFIQDPSIANEFAVAQSIIAALDDGGPPTSWINRLVLLLSDEAYVSSIRCRRMIPGGGNTAEVYFQEDDYVGAIAGGVSAVQVAGCVIWNSTDAPNKTGRNFIPAVSTVSIANGRFEAAYQTAIDNFIAKVITGLAVSAGTFLWCFWNQTDEVGYQITGGYLSAKPGTQRRREVPL